MPSLPTSFPHDRRRGARRGPAAAPLGLLLVAVAVVTACLLPSTAGAAPTAAARVGGVADAVVVATSDYGSSAALIAALGGAGVRADVVYPPNIALARVTTAAAARLRARGFAVLRAHVAPPLAASPETRTALAVLNGLADRAAGRHPVIPSDLQPLTNDLKAPKATSATGQPSPPGLAAPSLGGRLGFLPTVTEPAAFAAGSVTVSIIFPQSTGAQSSEDWTAGTPPGPPTSDPRWPDLSQRQAYIVGKVSTALAWWAARDPAAHLSFVIPAAGTLGAPQTVDLPLNAKGKTIEPITLASTNDQAWRHPIMDALGFDSVTTADTPPPEQRYDDAVRKANGTDWAFSLYVVDDRSDPDGMFSDFAFAYTFDIFGPYVVTTWQNDGYGPTLFDGVLAHEMGHVFGALDEYYTGQADYPSTGSYYSGYLWVQNKNAVSGGTTDYGCIMRGGEEGISAYEQNLFGCPSTRGQIGWRDSNKNGIPDVIDTKPSVTLAAPASDGSSATITGTVKENPWPRGHKAGTTDGTRHDQPFTHNISILVPHDVEYRIDGGSWGPAAAVDGAFDQPTEAISFVATPAGPGPDAAAPSRHLVDVRAACANSTSPAVVPTITGAATTKSTVAWIGATPVALALSRTPAVIRVGRAAKLTVVASDGGYPIAALSGVQVGPVGGARRSVTTGTDGAWTGSFSPRTTTTYQASFVPWGQFEATAPSGQLTVGVRALVTIHVGALSARHRAPVVGHLSPQRAGVPVVLQEQRNGVWTTVAGAITSARSNYAFVYRATHRGAVHLRVRFAGDALNLAATAMAPAFVVP